MLLGDAGFPVACPQAAQGDIICMEMYSHLTYVAVFHEVIL